MFSKLKTIFKPNKVMNKSIDNQLRESYPANVEGTNEFNELQQNVNESSELDIGELDLLDLDRLFNDPAIVGWSTTAEQTLLFTLLTLYYNPSESILDVGCGRGDLFGFIQEKHNINQTDTVNVNYTGIDYNPNIVNIATKKYDNINVIATDILNMSDNDKYDWVVASGAFNLKDYDDMFEYTTTVIDKMMNLSTKGIAFNVLTNLPDDLDDDTKNIYYVHDASKWLEYLLRTYSRVAIRADYMLGDCTFYIFK